MAVDVPMREGFFGVVAFPIADAIRVTLLLAFPAILILALPHLLSR